jgi:hypothetical protein
MRHAINSILKVIANARVAVTDGKDAAQLTPPMVELDPLTLRQVVGGDENLPKGGW